jgi:hypothetical protein
MLETIFTLILFKGEAYQKTYYQKNLLMSHRLIQKDRQEFTCVTCDCVALNDFSEESTQQEASAVASDETGGPLIEIDVVGIDYTTRAVGDRAVGKAIIR